MKALWRWWLRKIRKYEIEQERLAIAHALLAYEDEPGRVLKARLEELESLPRRPWPRWGTCENPKNCLDQSCRLTGTCQRGSENIFF